MCTHFTRSDTYHSEILKRPGGLDVLQRLGQVAQLGLDLALSLLGILDGLGLESVNGLELAVHVVGRGLEALEVALEFVDDGLVLQDFAVVREVDFLRLLGQELDLAPGVIVAFLEGLQGGRRLAAEAEGAGGLDPVDLESGAALGCVSMRV